MANTIRVSNSNIESILNSDLPVFILFWAGWSGPYKKMAPAFDQLAGQYLNKAVFAKVDVDEEPEVCHRYEVGSIPTLLFIRNGNVEATLMDIVSETTLKAELERLIEQT